MSAKRRRGVGEKEGEGKEERREDGKSHAKNTAKLASSRLLLDYSLDIDRMRAVSRNFKHQAMIFLRKKIPEKARHQCIMRAIMVDGWRKDR